MTSASTPSASRPASCTPPSRRPRTTASTPRPTPQRAGNLFERKIARGVHRVPEPAAPGRLDGLRRPARPSRCACCASTRDVCEHYQRAVPAHPRRRVPGHQPGPERARPPARRRPPQHLRGRRPGPVHLCLSGRRHAQHRGVRGRVPRHHGRAARAELPVDPDHPRRRQRRHRQQRRRKPKELWTDQGAGDPIVRYHADDEVDEAQWITREIARLHDAADRRSRRRRPGRTTAAAWGDIAVFYRTNAQSRVLEEQLMRADIPYRVVGGTRFYDRKEIKDAVAYVRAVVNPVDEVSIKRVLNEPKRGVGATSVGRLDAWATAHGLPFIDALRRADDAGVGGKAARASRRSSTCSTTWPALVAGGPGPLLQQLLERSGYLDQLEAERTIEAEGRLENLAELVGAANEVESVDEFLEQISLVSDTDDLDDDDQLGHAHDPALGQGPRVPGRVPHRAGGRRLPPPALAHRARPARGGAAARLRGHHPGPPAPLPHPRLEPDTVRRHPVQPAQPLPRRDPRRIDPRRRGSPARQPRRAQLRRSVGRGGGWRSGGP